MSVVLSGLIGAILASVIIGKNFDRVEKSIQVIQSVSNRGIIAYMLALQSQHYSIMHFILLTQCALFLVLETVAKICLVYYLNRYGTSDRPEDL